MNVVKRMEVLAINIQIQVILFLSGLDKGKNLYLYLSHFLLYHGYKQEEKFLLLKSFYTVVEFYMGSPILYWFND